MPDRTDPLTIWLIDPINYSGMAYYDAGLVGGLARAGADVTLVGSDEPLVTPPAAGDARFLGLYAGTGPGRPKWRRGLAYAGSTWRLWRSLRRSRPDWVIWNYVEQPTLDRALISRIRVLGSKVAFIAHETEPWESDHDRRNTYRWLIEEASDVVIVHGVANERSLLSAWSIRPERVIVSEHGDYRDRLDPSADRRAARLRLGLPEVVPMALFFGALRMSKGLATLLEAWPAVRETIPDATLVVAGRPYRGTDLGPLDSPPPGVIVRLGQVPTDVANDYYAACDIVTIPYDRVSTSGVLRFAYSAARPVVASDIGELHEHVEEGRTGWLVEPGDTAATARAIATALSDRGRAARYGAAAHAYAQQTFDWTTIATELHRELVERIHGSAGRT